jgi:anaerobic ribonucleoside-triphosphate reductase activating protein
MEVRKMNYQKITKCDSANGDGVRVTLWVSGCEHCCDECHNPQTWNPKSGKYFDDVALNELATELRQPYISGLTLSGGDPFHPLNTPTVSMIVNYVKSLFPEKTVWCYTGYTLQELLRRQKSDTYVAQLLYQLDILVDGRYQKELRDVSYPWAGSSNQRIWANENGAWVQSKYDKEYRERLNAKCI